MRIPKNATVLRIVPLNDGSDSREIEFGFGDPENYRWTTWEASNWKSIDWLTPGESPQPSSVPGRLDWDPDQRTLTMPPVEPHIQVSEQPPVLRAGMTLEAGKTYLMPVTIPHSNDCAAPVALEGIPQGAPVYLTPDGKGLTTIPPDSERKVYPQLASLPHLSAPVPSGTQCIVIQVHPGDAFLVGELVTTRKSGMVPYCYNAQGVEDVMDIRQLALFTRCCDTCRYEDATPDPCSNCRYTPDPTPDGWKSGTTGPPRQNN